MIISNEAPSRLIPYNVKSIEMANFDVPQFKLLSKAVAVDSIKYMIEALGEVLSIDAMTLTDGDFNYLFALQRIVGYGDEYPLLHRWQCVNGRVFIEQGGLARVFTRSDIVDMVKQYDEASEQDKPNFQDPKSLNVVPHACDHVNEINVTKEDLQIIQVPEVVQLDARLTWPRVNTLAESLLMKRDPEKMNLVDAARWVVGETMNEKFENLEAGGSSLFRAASKANAEYAHGYKRIVTKQCTNCGQDHDSIIHVDASLFFNV